MTYFEILLVLQKIHGEMGAVIKYSAYRELWAIEVEKLKVEKKIKYTHTTIKIVSVPGNTTFKTTFDYVCLLFDEYNNGEPL